MRLSAVAHSTDPWWTDLSHDHNSWSGDDSAGNSKNKWRLDRCGNSNKSRRSCTRCGKQGGHVWECWSHGGDPPDEPGTQWAWAPIDLKGSGSMVQPHQRHSFHHKPQLLITVTDWFEVELRSLVLVYALIHVASGWVMFESASQPSFSAATVDLAQASRPHRRDWPLSTTIGLVRAGTRIDGWQLSQPQESCS